MTKHTGRLEKRLPFFMELWKRNYGFPLLLMTLHFFFLTIPYLFGRIDHTALTVQDFLNHLQLQSLILTPLLALLLVYRIFGYIHDPDLAGLLFQLPKSRSQLYWSAQLLAFILLLLPRLFALLSFHLSALLLGIAKKTGFAEAAWSFWRSEYRLWVLGLALLGLSTLLFALSSGKGNALAISVLLMLLWPGLLLAIVGLFQLMLPGIDLSIEALLSLETYPHFHLLLFALSPLLASFFGSLVQQLPYFASYWSIAALIFVLAGWLAFVKRPMEWAGASEHERRPFQVLRFLISLLAGLGLGSIFAFVRATAMPEHWAKSMLPPFAIGVFLGTLLMSLVVDLLAERGAFYARQSLKRASLSLGGAIVLLLPLVLGFQGHFDRLPEPERYDRLSLIGEGTLQVEDQEAMAYFVRLLEEQNAGENPGLRVPRDPVSLLRYRQEIQQRLQGQVRLRTIRFVFEQDGERVLSRAFPIVMDQTLYEEMPERVKADPAVRLWLYHNGQLGFHSAYPSLKIHEEEPLNPNLRRLLRFEMEAEEAVVEGKRDRYKLYDDLLMEALLRDYQGMSLQERLALAQDPPASLAIHRGYYRQDRPKVMSHSYKDGKRLEGEKEPRMEEETLVFPLSSACKHFERRLQELRAWRREIIIDK